MRILATILSYVLKGLIKLYKYLISPLLGPKCRYLPTCSEYAYEAIDRFGPFRGGYLAVWRILRCNPWGGHGFDPVPPADGDRNGPKTGPKSGPKTGTGSRKCECHAAGEVSPPSARNV